MKGFNFSFCSAVALLLCLITQTAVSDDIVLETNAPVDELIRRGSIFERLKNKSEKERIEIIEEMRSIGLLPPVNDGFLIESGQGAGNALLNAGRGFGSTLEEAGLGSGMREYFDEAKAVRRHWEPDEDYSAMSLTEINGGGTMNVIRLIVLILGWIFSIWVVLTMLSDRNENGKTVHKKIFIWSLFLFCCSGFLMEYSYLPSSYSWTYHFSSALGRTIGTWLGTAIFIGSGIIVSAIVSGIALGVMKCKEKKYEYMQTKAIYENRKIEALDELTSGNIDKLTWAKALIAAEGNEEKAKAKYIEFRSKG